MAARLQPALAEVSKRVWTLADAGPALSISVAASSQLRAREELSAGEKQHTEPSSWGSKDEESEYKGKGGLMGKKLWFTFSEEIEIGHNEERRKTS